MAGQHDLHNHQIAVKFPHHIWRRIELAAEADKAKTPGVFIRDTIIDKVLDIPLSAEDAQIIADRIRRAEELGKMV